MWVSNVWATQVWGWFSFVLRMSSHQPRGQIKILLSSPLWFIYLLTIEEVTDETLVSILCTAKWTKVASSTSTTVTGIFWMVQGSAVTCQVLLQLKSDHLHARGSGWHMDGDWWSVTISHREAVFWSHMVILKLQSGSSVAFKPSWKKASTFLWSRVHFREDSGKHWTVKRFAITWRFDLKVFVLWTAYKRSSGEIWALQQMVSSGGRSRANDELYRGFWFHNF